MPRRTTLVLDDEVYEKLVQESIRRYGTARAISRVVSDLLKERFRSDLIKLIYSEKIARISQKEFEEFRAQLSRRIEER
ncbi:MAG: hypothetical protein ACP5KE_05085 [Candidatus Methanodesulfokora sp.]|jgi:predicted CopG family antitoxin